MFLYVRLVGDLYFSTLAALTLKYSNMSPLVPPMTCTNSWVSLNGDDSKPRFLGDADRMNPKSMWITWPSPSSKIFPICKGRIKRKVLLSLWYVCSSIEFEKI